MVLPVSSYPADNCCCQGTIMDIRAPSLRTWLAKAPQPVFVVYAIAAAFATYFCMYAFRKPFAAARFEGQQFRIAWAGPSIGFY